MGREIIEPHTTSSQALALHEMGMELNYARTREDGKFRFELGNRFAELMAFEAK